MQGNVPFRRCGAWIDLARVLGMTMAATATVQAAPAPFRYEQLFEIEQVVDAQVSPDGARVAVVTEQRKPDHAYSRHRKIWLVTSEGGEPRRVPAPDQDTSLENPIWSPDGQQLLHRVVRDKKNELALLDIDSQRIRGLQPCATGEAIGTVTWSPDGKRIAAICNGPNPMDPAIADAESRTQQAKGGLEAKTIVATRSRYYDSTLARPWSPLRRAVIADLEQTGIVEVTRSHELLDEPGTLQWQQADTLWLVGASANEFGGMAFVKGRVLHRYDVRERRLSRYGEAPSTGRMPVLTATGDFIVPAAGTVANAAPEAFRKTWELEPLEIFALTGGKQARQPLATREIYVGRSAPFLWSDAGSATKGDGTLYFQWFDRGSNRIMAFHPQRTGDAQWQDLTPAGINVTAFSLSADGRTMAIVRGDGNTPNDVYLLDPTRPEQAARPLTRFGDALRQAFAVSSVETVRWRSADDRFDIGGWLLKPAGYQAGKRYPLVLLVHGGPGVAFRNSFDAIHFEGAHQVPPELYLARGYLVLMVNPRGDPGYGRAHQEALLEGWEFATRYDLIPGVQEMVRRGDADPERLGIAGASYGGWVAAFAVTQTDIFKAASAHDPVIDTQLSSSAAYRGNLLSNYWMHSGFVDQHVLDAPFPTSDPRLVKSPILLRFGLRGEGPLPSQFFVSGLEYFTYLHAHCKPVEMILHPNEGHGINDGEALQDYVQRDLAWFDYWLLGEGELPYKPHPCHP